MNRYITTGVVMDASAGADVIVVLPGRREAQDAFVAALEVAAAFVPAALGRTVRSHGRERIEFLSGGRAQFRSVRGSGQRGFSADVCVVDEWESLTDAQREDVAVACIHGELIKA